MNRTVTTEASARFDEELADALRRYQEQQNISDPELADRAGIERKTLVRIRKGLLPNTGIMIAILNELGLELTITKKNEKRGDMRKHTYFGQHRGKANILLSVTACDECSIRFEDEHNGIKSSWEMSMHKEDGKKVTRKFAEMLGIIPIYGGQKNVDITS